MQLDIVRHEDRQVDGGRRHAHHVDTREAAQQDGRAGGQPECAALELLAGQHCLRGRLHVHTQQVTVRRQTERTNLLHGHTCAHMRCIAKTHRGLARRGVQTCASTRHMAPCRPSYLPKHGMEGPRLAAPCSPPPKKLRFGSAAAQHKGGRTSSPAPAEPLGRIGFMVLLLQGASASRPSYFKALLL
eukprot:365812-Chlamydomonas_euryale.AAC.6